MGKTTIKSRQRDDTARIVARIHGVSVSLVKKVRNGDRENEAIMATLVEYTQQKNNLIKHLEQLVQVEPQPEKYVRKAS